jgi:alkaline phosphatase
MPSAFHTSGIGRRDWLKSLAMGGAAVSLPSALAAPKSSTKVRGIVFMVSDGMSPGVIGLAETFSQLTRKRGTAWWRLYNDPAATRGLMDTASANSLVTDSAAASSAWGGGQRVHNGAINTTPNGREIQPIAAILKQKSAARIGLVTTATVTHATPAGFAASVPARSNEHAIAPQYLNRVDVILGGGSGFFDPALRPDGRDLAGEFEQAGYQRTDTRDALLAATAPKLLGTFTRGHLPFAIDRDHDPDLAARVPTLSEMAKSALSRFLKSDKPFLLQVEGARIDHAAHLNDIAGLLGDQLAFDDAVAAVLGMLAKHDDVLVVVTSDHGNSNPALNGMGNAYGESTQRFERIQRATASHERIFALCNDTKSRNPEMLAGLIGKHLGFTPKEDEIGALLAILDKRDVLEWNHQLDKPEGLLGQIAGNHTGIGWTGTTHTADPTLVTAIGPQAQRFAGMVKNTEVFGHFAELLG